MSSLARWRDDNPRDAAYEPSLCAPDGECFDRVGPITWRGSYGDPCTPERFVAGEDCGPDYRFGYAHIDAPVDTVVVASWHDRDEQSQPVPEPSALAMLVCGLLMFAVMARRVAAGGENR